MFFSSIKDINRYVKHLLLRKTDVLKTSILWERKFEKIHYLLKAKRYKVYSGNIYFGIIIFSCFWSTIPCLGFLLICFDWEIRVLSEFLRKWGWFHRYNERFPKCYGQKLKFQKTETRFCRQKNNYYNNLNIFLSPLYLFACKRKYLKTHFNT